MQHISFNKRRYKVTAYDNWKKVRMADEQTLPSPRTNPIIVKLNSPEFRSIFTPELLTLANLFKKYNYELRIAGGAVRDILMGIQPKDLDFATDATPDRIKDMFTKEQIRMINEKGEKHGTITARINDKENFEITTLRIDIATNGRHAQVQFTKDWKLDANRRDLTVNSMFLDLDGNVYDYFYGYDDLQNKRIVFVGDATTRIQEDYLRILRYFRFYGRIMESPDKHDEATIKAIRENIEGLSRISGERIWSEWNKILTGNFAMELTVKLLECGASEHIGLPKDPDVDNFRTVFRRALSNRITLKPISLIVSMLKNMRQVLKLHERLKLSNSDRDLAFFLIQCRECGPSSSEISVKPYQLLVFTQPTHKYEVFREYTKELLRYRGAIELLREFEQWTVPHFPINGSMLKDRGTEHKLIGLVITELKRLWVEEDFQLTENQLLDRLPKILDKLKEKHRIKEKKQKKE
ncbi:CCA tRNA nucleotidyltransferase 1, mitochondrial isoform X2 [Pseudomyrmex gracilis]|uniref:CCA tRNA nucleotidyltransferase 1, mitochondrial isoform X2 n=1 Tax=Pseudomyrmex gracilis TaxID=219809 RepID=UPI00099506A2|nr:CCA tRNA nucleotidyltransferase 1, mitochondrial isoform X2 [Pseudomyrmex gracilis]